MKFRSQGLGIAQNHASACVHICVYVGVCLVQAQTAVHTGWAGFLERVDSMHCRPLRPETMARPQLNFKKFQTI